MGIKCMHLLGRRRGHLRSLLVNNGWTDVRDFPAPQGSTFMSQWKKSRRHASNRQSTSSEPEAQ